MGMFLFIIGFLGGIVSIAILIFNAVKKKPKKKILISLGLCFVLFIAGASVIGSSSENTQGKVDEEIENIEDEEKEEIALTNEEIELLSKSYNEFEYEERVAFEDLVNKFEETSKDIQDKYKEDLDRMLAERDTWREEQAKIIEENAEKQKEIYLTSVKPWYEQILKEYDDSWEKLWKGTWGGIADNKITIKEASDNFSKLRNDKLSGLTKSIMEYEIPSEVDIIEKGLIEKFQENMALAVDVRDGLVAEASLVLDGIMELDVDIMEESINRGDAYMLKAVASMVELQQKLDVLEIE